MRNVDVLNSWKEIAVYLDRGVRTIQRWERTSGLPVQRINEGQHKGSVFAYKQDIDIWLRRFSERRESLKHSRNRDFAKYRENVRLAKELADSTKQLRNELHRLREDVQRTREQIKQHRKERQK